MEKWNFICDTATSGEMALSLMDAVAKVEAPFDATIIGMRMPGMDGAELGRRIKADKRLKDTIMIMLTSQGLRGDAVKMEKIGYAAYLIKPIRRSQLYDCIMRVMSEDPEVADKKESKIITRHSLSEEKWSNIRLLLVEDNIVNQKLTLRMLEKFGFRADVAANGKEAVRSLESFRYDGVLMDVQMPEMDGFEATRIIRDPDSRVIDHSIPIIAMTAHAMKGDRDRCLKQGMNDYISKPIQPEELLKMIEQYFSSQAKH